MVANRNGNGLSLFRARIKPGGVRSDVMARRAYSWFMRLEPEAQELVASHVYLMIDKEVRNFKEQSALVVIYCLNRYLEKVEIERRLEPGRLGAEVMRAAEEGGRLKVKGERLGGS
ncbi:MAG: hypothetical protein HN413_08130 [Chloroflexi bacterium]|jgi:hypothetical protein|nr:hypothetical protein [Chloroflexota bacterium]